MPEFYDMFTHDVLEVGEVTPRGLRDLEPLEVMDADYPMEHSYETDVEVEEEDYAEDIQYVPGSDTQFVEDTGEETVEVREKNWGEDKDHSQFVGYIKDKVTNIPRHSGDRIPGCERAAAYLKDCGNEISKAMRSDLGGEIDEEEVDNLRQEIAKMVDRLEQQIEKLSKRADHQKVQFISEGQCEECGSTAPMWHDAAGDSKVCVSCETPQNKGLEKTATTPILQIYVTPFERAITSTIINATVSGGRHIEEIYERLKNKYNFTPREELSFQQLIADYGYPIYKDRGLLNEPTDPTSGDNVEWNTNYHA